MEGPRSKGKDTSEPRFSDLHLKCYPIKTNFRHVSTFNPFKFTALKHYNLYKILHDYLEKTNAFDGKIPIADRIAPIVLGTQSAF
ncbi:hypothetical protein GCM10011339_21500 [Echinicola rosea]|uniref:Uncharacterized protein n=1 Tax=Echinicola rosea TaxID=1807691 RepID=A0ABQ1V1H7_9BACT|nr:hypothetical protein GCM10011339_21500 [Echinicola rosea]